jgi:hypothetical protein
MTGNFTKTLMARIRAKADAEAERTEALKQRVKLLRALAGLGPNDDDEEAYEGNVVMTKEPNAFVKALLAAKARRPRATPREARAAIMRC